MKINIFKIPADNLNPLLKKFNDVKLSIINSTKEKDWEETFYFSDDPDIKDIQWIKYYSNILSSDKYINKIYFGAHLFKKNDDIFVITYGKSHFYVRNFCDNDFGINLAKRVADKKEVKQTASKRFAGRKKKEIKSFKSNTELDSESGESIDYISASIIESEQIFFGKSSKFGASVIVSREDLDSSNINNLLDVIIDRLSKQENFDIPRLEVVKNINDIIKYDNELLDAILKENNKVESITDSHDIIGAEFIFFGLDYKYNFCFGKNNSQQFEEIEITNLRNFIKENNISRKDILKIKVKIENDQKSYSKTIKELIEYFIDDEKVILQDGKWNKFNKEYIEQINILVDSIDIDPTESKFKEIEITESEFNYVEENQDLQTKGYIINQDLIDLNYSGGDKDFSILEIGKNYKVEAWDLKKDETVYAVKFGTTQELSYVCNQAVGTLEIIRNKANLNKLNFVPKNYCLWLGFERKKLPNKLSEIKSIILKQQIDLFARKCREVGITPLLKFSKKIKK